MKKFLKFIGLLIGLIIITVLFGVFGIGGAIFGLILIIGGIFIFKK